jgi:hypothetical protein
MLGHGVSTYAAACDDPRWTSYQERKTAGSSVTSMSLHHPATRALPWSKDLDVIQAMTNGG